ncbi:MAG TPA: hypothetical protein VM118_11225 [Acidobacteriota bacterium]|nr:hypothetical protein [Acidobacteriota bacterium]
MIEQSAKLNEVNRVGKSASAWISEGLIIAGLPAFSYALAYAYEEGYCSVFNIPAQFIEVGLSDVLLALGALISGVSVVFLTANLLYMWFLPRALSSPLGRSLARISLVALLILGIIVLSALRPMELIIYGGLFLFFIVMELLFPLLTQRKEQSYSAKLAGQEEIEGRVDTLYDLLNRSMGRQAMTLVFSVILLLACSFYAGVGRARRQQDFLMPVGAPNFVVLRQYSDRFIMGRLSGDGNMLAAEFRIEPLAGSNVRFPESFQLKRIGPLVAAPPTRLEMPEKHVIESEMLRDSVPSVQQDSAHAGCTEPTEATE